MFTWISSASTVFLAHFFFLLNVTLTSTDTAERVCPEGWGPDGCPYGLLLPVGSTRGWAACGVETLGSTLTCVPSAGESRLPARSSHVPTLPGCWTPNQFLFALLRWLLLELVLCFWKMKSYDRCLSLFVAVQSAVLGKISISIAFFLFFGCRCVEEILIFHIQLKSPYLCQNKCSDSWSWP